MIKFLSIFKIVISLSLLLPIQLHAAGPYDGIYMHSGDTTLYFSVHENSTTNQIVVMGVSAEPSNNSWLAYIGTRSDNSATVTSIKGVSDIDVVSKLKVVFNNTGTATVTVLSCIEGALYYCSLPTGMTFSFYKIF